MQIRQNNPSSIAGARTELGISPSNKNNIMLSMLTLFLCDQWVRNNRLAAKGALACRLQRRTACKIQNGRQGAPKWRTGSGKVSTPRFLGVLNNFWSEHSFYEKRSRRRKKTNKKKTGGEKWEKKEKKRRMKIVATTSLPAVDRWNAARSRQNLIFPQA